MKPNKLNDEVVGLKKRNIRKLSLMLVLTMIMSLVLPLAAYAATEFKDVQKTSDGVTGWVYSDGYTGDRVTVDAYGNGGFLRHVTSDVYKMVYVAQVYDSVYGVYQDVYSYRYYFHDVVAENTNDDLLYRFGGQEAGKFSFRSGGAVIVGGGGGAPAPTPFACNAPIALKDGQATIDVALLLQAKDCTSITFTSDLGSYELPLSALDFAALAKELGVSESDLQLIVQIAKASESDQKAIDNAANALGMKLLGVPVDFVTKVASKDGSKSTAIKNFGQYVKRSLNLDNDANSSTATAALFDPATGTLSFIPAKFADKKAVLLSRSNSIYAILNSNMTFDDLNGHWAKNDVELLANKLIVQGSGNGHYEPSRGVTRAEAAIMIARALTLSPSGKSANFSDVPAGAAYSNAVNAVFEAGIIKGYSDDTFKPSAVISRSELASMLTRALAFVGKGSELTSSEADSVLSGFTDADKLGWAKQSMAEAVKAGIVQGNAGKLSGDAMVDRAQTAVMIKRLLSYMEFI